jgi:hypothetical protein
VPIKICQRAICKTGTLPDVAGCYCYFRQAIFAKNSPVLAIRGKILGSILGVGPGLTWIDVEARKLSSIQVGKITAACRWRVAASSLVARVYIADAYLVAENTVASFQSWMLARTVEARDLSSPPEGAGAVDKRFETWSIN